MTESEMLLHKAEPDELAAVIFHAMQLGDYDSVLPLAKRLVEIDDDVERSYSILAVTLIKTCDFEEAKAILQRYMLERDTGEDEVLPYFAGQLLTELNQLLGVTKTSVVH